MSGSEGHLPSGSDSSFESEVSSFCGRGQSLAATNSLLWPHYSASDFHSCMAPVSAFLHQLGIRVLRYLDGWLVLASSHKEAIGARDEVLTLCDQLGIIVNLEKSSLIPSLTVSYLGVRIDLQTFQASLTPLRIEQVFLIVEEFLCSREQSAKFWRVLFGHLVPRGCLHLCSVQLALRAGWDFLDEDAIVLWDDPFRENLLWWCTEGRLK